MFSIAILSFFVASSLAKPFYINSYEPALATPIHWNKYGATPLLAPVPIHLDLKTQYHYQDGFGTDKYGHSEPTASHHATQDAFGNKVGEFSYVKPDGTIHKTQYIADADGYRVASNDLPVGPAGPHLGHILRKRSAHYQYAPAPIVTPSGHLADTPDVAAAKAAHFLEHAKRGNYHITGSIAPTSLPYNAWSAPINHYEPTHYSSWSSPVSSWPAPAPSVAHSAHPIVTPDGYLKETPEVAEAKAAHLAEKLKVSKYNNEYSYEGAPSHYYSGPASIPVSYAVPHRAVYQSYAPISPDGQVTDTPEVVAAKASHFAEHAAALARNAHADAEHAPSVHQPYYAPAPYAHPSDVPADTPEVAQAKAEHLAEYARVASRSKRSIAFGTYPASTVPLTHSGLAPVSAPVILPHSTLALPYHLPKPVTHSAVLHSPFASSYQVVA